MNKEPTVSRRQSSAHRRGESRHCPAPAKLPARSSLLAAPGSPLRERSAFTLIEMLIVIAIIGLLTSLTLPALQGLFGIAGRRGGANVLAGAMEQARLAALQHGVSTYVGFPTRLADKETGLNSVIIFRGKRQDETGPELSVLSRWLRYPRGVLVDPSTLSALAAITNTSLPPLPKLATNNVTFADLKVVQFDRYGKLSPETPVEIRIGEATVAGTGIVFRPSANNYSALKVLPLTGRVKITDGVLDQ